MGGDDDVVIVEELGGCGTISRGGKGLFNMGFAEPVESSGTALVSGVLAELVAETAVDGDILIDGTAPD